MKRESEKKGKKREREIESGEGKENERKERGRYFQAVWPVFLRDVVRGLRLLGLGKELQSVGEKEASTSWAGRFTSVSTTQGGKIVEDQENEMRRTTWEKKKKKEKKNLFSRVKLKAILFLKALLIIYTEKFLTKLTKGDFLKKEKQDQNKTQMKSVCLFKQSPCLYRFASPTINGRQ